MKWRSGGLPSHVAPMQSLPVIEAKPEQSESGQSDVKPGMWHFTKAWVFAALKCWCPRIEGCSAQNATLPIARNVLAPMLAGDE